MRTFLTWLKTDNAVKTSREQCVRVKPNISQKMHRTMPQNRMKLDMICVLMCNTVEALTPAEAQETLADES